MALAAGSGSLAAEQAAFETQWGSFLESAAARKQAREEARRDRILQHAAWIIQSRPLARGWDGWRLSVERRVESHENVHRAYRFKASLKRLMAVLKFWQRVAVTRIRRNQAMVTGARHIHRRQLVTSWSNLVLSAHQTIMHQQAAAHVLSLQRAKGWNGWAAGVQDLLNREQAALHLSPPHPTPPHPLDPHATPPHPPHLASSHPSSAPHPTWLCLIPPLLSNLTPSHPAPSRPIPSSYSHLNHPVPSRPVLSHPSHVRPSLPSVCHPVLSCPILCPVPVAALSSTGAPLFNHSDRLFGVCSSSWLIVTSPEGGSDGWVLLRGA